MPPLPTQSDFQLEDYVLYNLNRTSATYTREMSEGLSTINMEQSQWRVLAILGDKDKCTISEIARKGVFNMSTLTRMLERMERSDLVKRIPGRHDKRFTEVTITRTGKAELAQALSINALVYKKAFANIPDSDIKHLNRILQKVSRNLSDSNIAERPRGTVRLKSVEAALP